MTPSFITSGAVQPDPSATVLVYTEGHEGDPKFVVASVRPGPDGRFSIALPSPGTYAVDVTDLRTTTVQPLPGPGPAWQMITVVQKSWKSLAVPPGGVNLGEIMVPPYGD
jgi:hypothetical protein